MDEDKVLIESIWDDWVVAEKGFLGHGAYGRVYKVYRKSDKTSARAVKIIDKKKQPNSEKTLEEINIMYNLGPEIDGIVRIEDYKETKNNILFRMELLEGTLEEKIKCRELNVFESMHIVLQICDTLCQLETKEIIHRDVKPANIMWSFKKKYKLGDFGSAVFWNETSDGRFCGTLLYAPPEIINNEQDNGTIDRYSLGVIMYEMLTNHLIRQEEKFNFKVDKNLFPIYEELGDIIQKLCDSKIENRYSNGEQLKKEIQKWLGLHREEEKVLEESNPERICEYAEAFSEGENKDLKKMMYFFELARKAGSKAALYKQAMIYLKEDMEKNEGNAIELLKEASNGEYAPAQNWLGCFYLKKISNPDLQKEGVKILKKSAEQGYAPAQYNLALAYIGGVGCERDKNVALGWMEKSAAQNYTLAVNMSNQMK